MPEVVQQKEIQVPAKWDRRRQKEQTSWNIKAILRQEKP